MNLGANDAGSLFAMKNKSVVMTAQSVHFIMSRGKASGFIKDRCDGLSINSNITIAESLRNSMRRNGGAFTVIN